MSSPENLEMNDVKSPLMGENDLDKAPEVEFKGSKQDIHSKKDNEFHGLTKEELEKFAKDPFWRKLRIILFVLFWIVWVGMLIAAILIVVMSPKCPKKPKLEFWEQKTGYWLDPFAFVDSDNDGVGDFKGIMSKLDYIEKQLGAGYIILDPIFKGQFSSKGSRIGLVESFLEFDPILGPKESLIALIKEARKRGIEIVLVADFNAVTFNSTILQKDWKNRLIPWSDNFSGWPNREGNRPTRKRGDTEYYSAIDSQLMYELNLKNNEILAQIKAAVKYWLDSGIRGFMLTNIGMYVENPNIQAVYKSDDVTKNSWYHNISMNGQIYSNETLLFLKEIRKTIDEVAKRTDKSRLLIVDAGDIGFGVDKQDDLLQYLGGTDRLADMVIGREFLTNRGWKLSTKKSISSVRNYMDTVPADKRKRIALTSATSTNIRSNDLLNLASPFVVQGSSILYYGSELGVECDIATINSLNLPFYPKNKKFSEINGELPTKCNHMIMQWDNTGKGFGNSMNITHEYIMKAKNTVQSLTAVGVGETVLQLHQKLIKLRKEPSFQSGNISMIFNEQTATHSYEIFSLHQDGFPIVIGALLRDSINDGKVFSFDSTCKKVIPLLVYPSNPNLQENKEIESNNIYLHIRKAESIHVFKCV